MDPLGVQHRSGLRNRTVDQQLLEMCGRACGWLFGCVFF